MNKPNVQPLIELIKEWKINQTMLAEKIGMKKSLFQQKISPNVKGYAFTDIEFYQIQVTLRNMVIALDKFVDAEHKARLKQIKSEKFQNNPEKTKGVVSGKNKEFAGGTLTAHGKNSPDAFRPVNTKFVIHDCDENGNPVTI